MVVDRKFIYKQTGKPVHSLEETGSAKWFFVLSTSKILCVRYELTFNLRHYIRLPKREQSCNSVPSITQSSNVLNSDRVPCDVVALYLRVIELSKTSIVKQAPCTMRFHCTIVVPTMASSLGPVYTIDSTRDMTPVDEEGNLAGKQRSSNHLRCNSSEDDFNFEAEEINPSQGGSTALAENNVAFVPSCNKDNSIGFIFGGWLCNRGGDRLALKEDPHASGLREQPNRSQIGCTKKNPRNSNSVLGMWELTIAFAKEHCDISIMDKGAATKAPPSVQMVVEALAGDLEWRDTNDSTSGFTRCGASSCMHISNTATNYHIC
ncbi:hypothetical protein GOBAR_DD31347 [Gossypium barbadense]|nr:hypothetical protein GOBAR_DD31347 [Gossypium barbadense]